MLLYLLVQVERLGMASLSRLRPFNRRHEGVRDGRIVDALRRRQAVEGDADGELQGAELEPRRVGRAPRARAGVAEGRRRRGEEGGDGVEGGGLGVAAAAGDGDGVVEGTRGLVR